MSVSKPVPRIVAAVGILVTVAAGVVFLQTAESRRADNEIAAALAARKTQVAELLTAQLQSLELRGQNAGANPRLVAALSGNVSSETLRDLFQTESWWQPYREAFAGTYLAAPGQKPVFITGKAEITLAVDDLVAKVRQSRWVGSALVGVAGWAHVVIAVPVIMPSGPSPVLLLTQPFDGADLGPIAERTGAAVVLSDGRQALVGAGPSAETAALKQVVGREADPQGGRLDGAVVAIHQGAPGLYLLSYVNTAGLVARATAGLAAVRVALGVVGAALLLFVLVPLARRRKPAPAIESAASGSALAATATEASSGSRYTLLQRIGGGGMAEVHLAVSVGERGFRRPCVVKRLRPELSANPSAVAQFTDEATLASSLVHANIVPIFDFARVGSQYFLVEEYIVGRDLGRLVRRARSLGKPIAADLVHFAAVEALKALDYAHAKRDHDGSPLGIVHRDVSPENLMVTVRGEVQLLDFGVIKVDESRSRRTDIGELKGNLSFIAPEQARGLDVDGRADLFSLGLVMYFALTGEPLYGSETGYELLVRAASGPSAVEAAKIARLPAPFASVLMRALAPRPEGRFPNAMAFAEALGPPPADAAARLGTLVSELFGEELAQEQQNLSTGTGARGVGSSGSGAQVLLGPGATLPEEPVPLPLRGNQP